MIIKMIKSLKVDWNKIENWYKGKSMVERKNIIEKYKYEKWRYDYEMYCFFFFMD